MEVTKNHILQDNLQNDQYDLFMFLEEKKHEYFLKEASEIYKICPFCQNKPGFNQIEFNQHFETIHQFELGTLHCNINMVLHSAKSLFIKIKELRECLNDINFFMLDINNFSNITKIKQFYFNIRLALEYIVVGLLSFYNIKMDKSDRLEESLIKMKILVLYQPSLLNSFFAVKNLIGSNVHNISDNNNFFDINLADKVVMNFRMVIDVVIDLFNKKEFETNDINKRKFYDINNSTENKREVRLKINKDDSSSSKKYNRNSQENKNFLGELKNKRNSSRINIKRNNYKTALCKKWTEYNYCSSGRDCKFAHGKHDLRKSIY